LLPFKLEPLKRGWEGERGDGPRHVMGGERREDSCCPLRSLHAARSGDGGGVKAWESGGGGKKASSLYLFKVNKRNGRKRERMRRSINGKIIIIKKGDGEGRAGGR